MMIGRKVPKPENKSQPESRQQDMEFRLTVKNCHDADLDDSMAPGLDVLGGQLHVLERVLSVTAAVRFRDLGSASHDGLVFGIEKVSGLVIFWHEPEASEAIDDGDESLEDVEPKSMISVDGHQTKKGGAYHRHPG